MSEPNTHKENLRLTTIKKMAKMPQYRNAFSEASLRALVFNADNIERTNGRIQSNGLKEAGAIYRVGRKVLIDLDAFDSWLSQQN